MFSSFKSRSKQSARSAGFTLIEVMIVVAIIAILAAVAIPNYRDYVRRGQAAEAFSALSDFRSKMEQYYQDNRKYGTGSTCAADSTAASWHGFAQTDHFRFECATDSTNQQSYTLTAVGTAGAVVSDAYSIDQNGNRSTSVFKGVSVSAACWLSRGNTC